jgi:predicted O-methyltransferase YrrM
MLRRLGKGLKYLLRRPDYVFYYFAHKLSSVLQAATGATAEQLAELRSELEQAPDFAPRIQAAARSVANETWELDGNHHFLYALVRLIRPRIVVETGVFDGFYSACFLQALSENERREGKEGSLVSIDLPANEVVEASTSRLAARTGLPRGEQPGWVIPGHLRRLWRPYFGDSRQLLPEVLSEVSEIDLFFHDSLHTREHMLFEFETAWPKLSPGGFLLSHDVHWNGAFRHFARATGRKPHVAHGFGLLQKG